MKLIILDHCLQASEWAAKCIKNCIIQFNPRPDKCLTMGLPTGLPRDYSEIYHSFMWNNFFKYIGIDPGKPHILSGNGADLQAECDSFEEQSKDAGGIELFVGGIGSNGHISINELGSSLVSRIRVKTLAIDTILANAQFFHGDLAKVPTMALMVGVGTSMETREVMILITGVHKAFTFQQHPHTIIVCDEKLPWS
ncbi:PREDICTED: glucosamine-6-phosphate isomerase 1-like [Chrysochloris asiatica]|uniref:Glucosamine-6-phosphate isomerase 1-like n=1 Tax=Chrysochloris asiatica TaxID=185453 RepID=A0A9B0WQB6_CHRAS|nr:PREDICTED: glucosamine-6-phosphate isomerase 1-like [Chrysochloris asiatica]